jgi:sugar O-acyltransferase (sialic acid O-acetyltransferase NeuD family)
MRLVLLGGGGHCESCVEVIAGAGLQVVGVLDSKAGSAPAGTAWLGDDDWLATAQAAGLDFLVTVGQTNVSPLRRRLFEMLRAGGHRLATVRSPHAVVSSRADLGAGTVVMHGATVNTGVRVGENCIVNTGAILDHGCAVEAHCHVSTGAILNGDVRVGSGTMVGSGAVVLQGISIAPDVMIGAGAVVTHNIDSPGLWVGVPAKRLS